MSAAKNKIYSMTGFGQSEDGFEDWSWVWEVRAVNGKSLDVRMRLPGGYESLEPKIRTLITQKISRGNLQISLKLQTQGADLPYRLNQPWLDTLIGRAQEISNDKGTSAPDIGTLFNVKGVVEDFIPNATDPAFEKRNAQLLASLQDMVTSLNRARAHEGQALADILRTITKAMAEQITDARQCAGGQAAAIKQKFDERFAELIGDNLAPEALAHEAAMLALKADVREELDRLSAHMDSAQKLLGESSPIGRKLDFLSQELLREVNTLCSKSADIELTNIGLALKSLVEQFREQSANVE